VRGFTLLDRLSQHEGPTEVFRARADTGELVAIKMLRDNVQPVGDVRFRLDQERDILAELGGRHHLVRLISSSDDPVALVLEHLPGGDLRRHLRPDGFDGAPHLIGFDEARRVARHVGEALDHLHRHGVLHRDVKSSNVVFDAHGDATLIDLGIAARGNPPRGLPDGWIEEQVGTLGYAAPEVVRDPATASVAADVHGLAAMLYEALTGRLPYMLEDVEDEAALRRRIVAGGAPTPVGSPVAAPRRIIAVLDRALSVSPEVRFQGVGEFVRAFVTGEP
jgi:serine/threonine protein kinase